MSEFLGNPHSPRIAARVYPYMMALPFVFLPFLPRSFNAVFITYLGIAVGGGLCIAAAFFERTQQPLPRWVAVALGVTLSTAIWFSLSSLWADNPRLALYSPRAASTWMLLAVWITAGALLADSRALRETISAVAAAGSFTGAAAIYEALTQGIQRTQGYAAGFLENSTSSGAMLAVAIIAAVAGFMIARSQLQRGLYVAACLICAAALVMSSSRAAWLGLVAVVLLGASISYLSLPRSKWWLLAAVPSGLAGLVTLLEVGASAGVFGAGALRLVAELGTDRDAIWRSAWAQFVRAPLVGEGIGQFSATITSGLSAIPTATYDTHNMLIGATVGGGLVAFALVLGTFYSLANAGITVAMSTGRARSAVLLACLPVLMLTVGLFAWVDSAALLAIAALFGAYVGSYLRNPAARTEPAFAMPGLARSAALLAGAGALVISVLNLGPTTLLYQYSESDATKTPPTLDQALSLYERLPEGRAAIYLLGVLRYELNTGSTDAKKRAPEVLRLVEPDAEVDVTVAARGLALAQALGNPADPAGFPLVEEFGLAGTKADPASGNWYAILAYDAERRGMHATAVKYAREALKFRQDEATRSRLTTIVGP